MLLSFLTQRLSLRREACTPAHEDARGHLPQAAASVCVHCSANSHGAGGRGMVRVGGGSACGAARGPAIRRSA